LTGLKILNRKDFLSMSDLKVKRLASGISGSVLCAKIGLSRSRLSLIERGYITPSSEELARIALALDELIEAKSILDRVAASVGWPPGVHRDQ
jgi:transcriptional regulator with XRE-family HTH domain